MKIFNYKLEDNQHLWFGSLIANILITVPNNSTVGNLKSIWGFKVI